jgi:hypothetical protein
MTLTRFLTNHQDGAIAAIHQNSAYHTAETCARVFGFTPDPLLSIRENAAAFIRRQYPPQYFSLPSNLTVEAACQPPNYQMQWPTSWVMV